MEEIVVTCKNCGFEQRHVRNPDNPGRIACQNCGKVIIKKPRENKPKEKPIWLLNKYLTKCRKCRRFIGKDERVAWTPHKKGVLCDKCCPLT